MGESGPSRGQWADPPQASDLGRRSERVLAARDRILELIATAKPLDEVLGAIAAAIEAHGDGAIAGVMLLDEDAERLRHAAGGTLPPAFRGAQDGLRAGPAAGAAGTAVFRGAPVIVEEIATDPLWSEQAGAAAAHGLCAAWAQPILAGDRKVLGAIAVYRRRSGAPSRDEQEFVAAVAQLGGIAVERHRSEQKRRATERRLLRQKTVLVELAKSEALAGGQLLPLCKFATEASAKTLEVERVGVWMLNDERSVLRAVDLYELSSDRHSSGVELQSSRYPRYFAALERGRSVVAHDARADPDTSEYAGCYLVPLGITSMLDAPIRKSGQLVGVVCHEHVGPRRVWAADEQDFAASVGDFLSLGLEASERRRAEQAFRSAQEELLRQDFQARRQIETELERIQAELVRQTRLATLGQIAEGIAHDLGRPLAEIRRAVSRLRRAPGGTRGEEDPLALLEREVGLVEATIAALLEKARRDGPGV